MAGLQHGCTPGVHQEGVSHPHAHAVYGRSKLQQAPLHHPHFKDSDVTGHSHTTVAAPRGISRGCTCELEAEAGPYKNHAPKPHTMVSRAGIPKKDPEDRSSPCSSEHPKSAPPCTTGPGAGVEMRVQVQECGNEIEDRVGEGGVQTAVLPGGVLSTSAAESAPVNGWSCACAPLGPTSPASGMDAISGVEPTACTTVAEVPCRMSIAMSASTVAGSVPAGQPTGATAPAADKVGDGNPEAVCAAAARAAVALGGSSRGVTPCC